VDSVSGVLEVITLIVGDGFETVNLPVEIPLGNLICDTVLEVVKSRLNALA